MNICFFQVRKLMHMYLSELNSRLEDYMVQVHHPSISGLIVFWVSVARMNQPKPLESTNYDPHPFRNSELISQQICF